MTIDPMPKSADQIERRVEMRVDALDSLYMSGRLTKAEYDDRMKRIHDWADNQYRILEYLRFYRLMDHNS